MRRYWRLRKGDVLLNSLIDPLLRSVTVQMRNREAIMNKERCIGLVYKIANSEDGIIMIDNDMNIILNKTAELKELQGLFNQEDEKEVNFICGLFALTEEGLETLNEWKEEMKDQTAESYWKKCVEEFWMNEEDIRSCCENFIKTNFAKLHS